jgi:hypothetical protein
MATLSPLAGNQFHAFRFEGQCFLAAFAIHPNPCWKSSLQQAPGLLPDPVLGGADSAPLFYFFSEPPAPGVMCIQMTQPVTICLRFDAHGKSHVHVHDGHGVRQVEILEVD